MPFEQGESATGGAVLPAPERGLRVDDDGGALALMENPRRSNGEPPELARRQPVAPAGAPVHRVQPPPAHLDRPARLDLDRRREALRRGLVLGKAHQGAVVPLLDRVTRTRDQPRTDRLPPLGSDPHVDRPPGHAPSASLSLDQKPGARRGGSPSCLASSWKIRSRSSVSRSGVHTWIRIMRSPVPFCPRAGNPLPLSRSTVLVWVPEGIRTRSSP